MKTTQDITVMCGQESCSHVYVFETRVSNFLCKRGLLVEAHFLSAQHYYNQVLQGKSHKEMIISMLQQTSHSWCKSSLKINKFAI